MTVSSFRRLVATVVLSTFSLPLLQAQQAPNPDEKPRKVKQELKTAYKNWITDVDLILTQSERDAWAKLSSDEDIDQTLLRPAVDVDYVVLKDGKEIAKQTEDWRELNDAGQRLTLTRLIDTRTLVEGEYQIQVHIRDRITGETITPGAKFTIVQ